MSDYNVGENQTIRHFSVSLAIGGNQTDAPKLLLKGAKQLDTLTGAKARDVLIKIANGDESSQSELTAYYDYPDGVKPSEEDQGFTMRRTTFSTGSKSNELGLAELFLEVSQWLREKNYDDIYDISFRIDTTDQGDVFLATVYYD
jgi:hypothetical protein